MANMYEKRSKGHYCKPYSKVAPDNEMARNKARMKIKTIFQWSCHCS